MESKIKLERTNRVSKYQNAQRQKVIMTRRGLNLDKLIEEELQKELEKQKKTKTKQ